MTQPETDIVALAAENSEFEDAFQRIARSFVSAERWSEAWSEPEASTSTSGSSPWGTLRSRHLLSLLNRFADHLERAEQLEYLDVRDDMNPLRNLWQMCFESFAKCSIRATNHVTQHWTTSAQDDKDFLRQQAAVGRNVTIERTYIFDPDVLQDDTANNLRYAIIRQLNAKIKVRHITPQLVESKSNTSRLKTKDFIVFDDALVYCTIVDTEEKESDRDFTFVKLHHDPDMLQYARDAWNAITTYADDLNYDNLHEYVDPYGQLRD